MSNQGIPYIGSRITLISKSEIRYEGTLYQIDTENSTVSLQSVRSFGTEGRPRQGPQIPPSSEVYEYIIFSAADIKDLHVNERPKPTAKIPNDPAIVSIQAPKKIVQQNQQQQARAKPVQQQQESLSSLGTNPVNTPWEDSGHPIGSAELRQQEQQRAQIEKERQERNRVRQVSKQVAQQNQNNLKYQQQQQRGQQKPRDIWQQNQNQNEPQNWQNKPKQQPASRSTQQPASRNVNQQQQPSRQVRQGPPKNAWSGGNRPNFSSVSQNGYHRGKQSNQRVQQNNRRKNNQNMPGMGSHLMNMRTRSIGGKNSSKPKVPDNMFDFAAGLEQFADFDPKKSAEVDETVIQPVVKYDKKTSFFDSISCSALDKLEKLAAGAKRRPNYRTRVNEENRLNMDTFGATSLNQGRHSNGNNRVNYRGNNGRRNERKRNNNFNNRATTSSNWRSRNGQETAAIRAAKASSERS